MQIYSIIKKKSRESLVHFGFISALKVKGSIPGRLSYLEKKSLKIFFSK